MTGGTVGGVSGLALIADLISFLHCPSRRKREQELGEYLERLAPRNTDLEGDISDEHAGPGEGEGSQKQRLTSGQTLNGRRDSIWWLETRTSLCRKRGGPGTR